MDSDVPCSTRTKMTHVLQQGASKILLSSHGNEKEEEGGLTVFLPRESDSRILPTDMYKCTHKHTLGYTHTCTHACTSTYICAHMHTSEHAPTLTHAHVYTRALVHTQGTEREMMRKVTPPVMALKWKDFVVYLVLNSIRIHYFLYLIIMVLVINILKNEANNILTPTDE